MTETTYEAEMERLNALARELRKHAYTKTATRYLFMVQDLTVLGGLPPDDLRALALVMTDDWTVTTGQELTEGLRTRRNAILRIAEMLNGMADDACREGRA